MVFVTLGEALESALASMMNDGDGAVAAAPDACKLAKSAGTEAPASTCREDTVPLVQEDDASRYRHTGAASPKAAKGSPARPVCLYLVVDNGKGGGRRWGATSTAYRADSGEGNPARELKLVR